MMPLLGTQHFFITWVPIMFYYPQVPELFYYPQVLEIFITRLPGCFYYPVTRMLLLPGYLNVSITRLPECFYYPVIRMFLLPGYPKYSNTHSYPHSCTCNAEALVGTLLCLYRALTACLAAVNQTDEPGRAKEELPCFFIILPFIAVSLRLGCWRRFRAVCLYR